MAEPNAPDLIPELAELRKPVKAFTLPEPKELTGLSTQMGRGVPGVAAPTDYEQAVKQYKTPMEAARASAGFMQRESELERDIQLGKQAQEQLKAEQEASIATQQRQAREEKYKQLQAVRSSLPRPQMHPTKENIQSLSTLFGLIGVIGMAMGGSGKMSAQNALNSMTGMMKGWQQGRADLWKKEMQEFDKEMARIKSILEDALKDAEMAEKQIISNADEARALAQQAQAKLGGQVSKQILEKQGISKFREYLSDVYYKALSEADKRAFEREKFGAEQSQRERQFQLQERRLALQEKREELKEKKQTDTGEIPKDAKTKEEYRARYEIIKNIEDIQSLLDDPKYSKLITPATKFTPDVINNLRTNFPELSQKLARIQAIEFQIGGKALTAKEQEILSPIYGWKGLTADALKSRVAGVRENLQDVNDMTEVYYPGLKRIHSEFDRIYEQKGKVPEVPSAGGGDLETRAKTAFGSYEPNKYDYRVTDDGRVQRKLKE